MKTETYKKEGSVLKIFALVGILILAIAFIFGVWGFFGRRSSMAGKDNQNHPQLTGNSPMLNKELKEKPKVTGEVPKALADAGEFGENIYDAAKADDWKIAETKLSELKAAVKELDAAKTNSESLAATLQSLEKAVGGKNKNATLETANKFTLEATNLTARYDPKVPVEVTRLDYYGRELEIWAAEKNEARLKQTALEIRKTWDEVKPQIVARNAAKEAAVFENLIKKTEAAKSISDYAKLATPILDEVDNLEKIFK